MDIKGSTIYKLTCIVWMALAWVSWLTGRGFMVGAACLTLGLLYLILSRLDEFKERGQ